MVSSTEIQDCDDFRRNKFLIFFFNDTTTTEIYTLSLHDALPICPRGSRASPARSGRRAWPCGSRDRKSTRLNSSHSQISYAVFCLKKKKKHASITSPETSLTIHKILIFF